MPWWGWMIIGALLFGSELLIVDAGFYLVFIGIAAALTGLVGMMDFVLEPWVQWVLFSAIALTAMVLFRKKALYQAARLRGWLCSWTGRRDRHRRTNPATGRKRAPGLSWHRVDRGQYQRPGI